MADRQRRLFAVQFHPEVAHTPQGKTVLANFVRACGARGDWSMASFIDSAVQGIRDTVGDDEVLCALSGGVDSSVVAVLIHKAIGDRLTCLFVDNGLLRQGEVEGVVKTFRDAFKIKLIHVDATDAIPRSTSMLSRTPRSSGRPSARSSSPSSIRRRGSSATSRGWPRARSIPT